MSEYTENSGLDTLPPEIIIYEICLYLKLSDFGHLARVNRSLSQLFRAHLPVLFKKHATNIKKITYEYHQQHFRGCYLSSYWNDFDTMTSGEFDFASKLGFCPHLEIIKSYFNSYLPPEFISNLLISAASCNNIAVFKRYARGFAGSLTTAYIEAKLKGYAEICKYIEKHNIFDKDLVDGIESPNYEQIQLFSIIENDGAPYEHLELSNPEAVEAFNVNHKYTSIHTFRFHNGDSITRNFLKKY